MKSTSFQKMVFLGSVLCVVISLVAFGCEPTPPTPTKPTAPTTPTTPQIKMGGVVRLCFSRDASIIGYPPRFSSPVENQIYPTAIENLGYFDVKGGVVPGLALSWKADATTNSITLELRKGVKFHDGTDFNAEAAKWNIDQYIAAKRTDILIKSVDIIDDYNIRVNLPSWDSDCVWKLLYYAGSMISPTAFKNAGTDDKARQDWAIKNPVGTGPFMFVSKQQDVKTVYKKNPNYWQKDRPYLDGIEWVIIADPLVQMASLKAGDVDILCDVTPANAKTLKDSGFRIKTAPGSGTLMTVWSDSLHADSPFNKLPVRQAISHAIDVKAITDSQYFGYAVPTTQWADPASYEYNPDVKGYPYNAAKAKQLLADAGYPNGFKATILLANNPTHIAVCTAIQAYLKAVGIEVNLDVMDEARRQSVSYTAGWTNGMNFSGPRGWGSLSQMRRFLHSKLGNYPGMTNVTLHPPIIDELLDKAFAATDDKTKQQYLWQLQKAVNDDYNLINALFIVNSIGAESLKVMQSGYFEMYASQFRPPTEMWLNK